MEEKKNNATEKVENISQGNSYADELKLEIENAQKPAYSTVNDKNLENVYLLSDKKAKKSTAERERERMEKAKLRAEKKQAVKEKQKAKKQEKLAKRQELKALKLAKKEERLKRRDLLKSETKLDRMERIAAEKQAKREAKKARRDQKANLKMEKLQAKRQAREQKRLHRQQNRRDRRSRGIGGWLAAVISLASCVLVLSTLFTFSLVGNWGGKNMFESEYERYFYEFVSGVENMDVSLAKLMVSQDSEEQQKLLVNVGEQATLASNDLSLLPLDDEVKFNTQKFVNQVGDFSKYAVYKLIDGEKLSKTDKETISSIYEINSNLKNKLTETASQLKEDFKFTSLLNKDSENLITSSFSSLEESAITYPKMIYDGPFSDGLETKTIKGLTGEELTQKQAQDVFSSIFEDYSITNVQFMSEVTGRIPCYAFEGKINEDERVYGEISKVGGKLILAECYKDCSIANKSGEECIEIAQVFIEKLGVKNMEPVWETQTEGVCYINFAKLEKGVIVYPDMIKVKVCQSRGVVSGFDATEYYLNHTSRKIEKPQISKEKAIKNLSKDVEVESVKPCIIPKNTAEILCYEVAGSYNGSTYYIYVNAKTGKEVEIFKVVETNQGRLLM